MVESEVDVVAEHGKAWIKITSRKVCACVRACVCACVCVRVCVRACVIEYV